MIPHIRVYTDSNILADMVVPRTVKQSSCIFGETNAGSCFKSPPYHYVPGWLESRVTWVQSAVDSAIDTGFYKPLSVFAKLYTPHMPKFHVPTIRNCRNNSKTAPISLYFVTFDHGFVYISAIFSCDQAAIWLVQSVCLSVCLSVCPSVTPFSPCSHHRIIMKLSGVITNDKSKVHAKGQGQRSKVKVTEVTIQLNLFRTVTQVWIHIWWWNDAYSLMLLRRGALLFFKVICQISRSHGSKHRRIWPRLGVSGL